jgi:hypothetical protein
MRDHVFAGATGPEIVSPGSCTQIVAVVMTGVDPHRASHTPAAVSADEAVPGQVRARPPGDPGQAAAGNGRRRGRSGPGR